MLCMKKICERIQTLPGPATACCGNSTAINTKSSLAGSLLPRSSSPHITNVFSFSHSLCQSRRKIKGEVNIKCHEEKNGRKG